MIRWLVPGAVVALAPKCVLCVAAYLGLGTTLGWTGAEICGAPDNEAMLGVAWLAIAGSAVGVGARVVWACGLVRHRQPTRYRGAEDESP